ncbi:hypothetical protein KUCAC02_036602, partial [Chaenocephalus aceratus]
NALLSTPDALCDVVWGFYYEHLQNAERAFYFEDEWEEGGTPNPGEQKPGRLDLGLKPEPGSFVRLADLLKVSSQNEGSGLEMVRRRPKRSVFLHSGVRICPQETINEVLASHQAYYQLRVCQEAVWEAFRIFFDRIPGTTEYQKWVHTCQHESLCISDLAQNFSSSEEHMSIITRRLKRMKERRPPSRGTVTPAPQIPEATGNRSIVVIVNQKQCSDIIIMFC